MSILTLTTIEGGTLNVTLETLSPDLPKTDYSSDPLLANYKDLSDYTYLSVKNMSLITTVDKKIDTQCRIAIEHPRATNTSDHKGYHLPNDSTIQTNYGIMPNHKNYKTLGPNTGVSWPPYNYNDYPDHTDTFIDDTVAFQAPLFTNDAAKDNNLTLIPYEESSRNLTRPTSYAFDSLPSVSTSYLYLRNSSLGDDPIKKGIFNYYARNSGSFGTVSSFTSESDQTIDRLYSNIPTEIQVNGATFPIAFTYNTGAATRGKFTIVYKTSPPTSIVYNGIVVPVANATLIQNTGLTPNFTASLNLTIGALSNEDPRQIVTGGTGLLTPTFNSSLSGFYNISGSDITFDGFVITTSSGVTTSYNFQNAKSIPMKTNVTYFASGAVSDLKFETKEYYLGNSLVYFGDKQYVVSYNPLISNNGILITYPTNHPFVCDVTAIRGITSNGMKNRSPIVIINPFQNQGILRSRKNTSSSSHGEGCFLEIMNTRIKIQTIAELGLTSTFTTELMNRISYGNIANGQYILLLPSYDPNITPKSNLISQIFDLPYDVSMTARFYFEYKTASDTTWKRLIDTNDIDEKTIDVFSEGGDGPFSLKIVPTSHRALLSPVLFRNGITNGAIDNSQYYKIIGKSFNPKILSVIDASTVLSGSEFNITSGSIEYDSTATFFTNILTSTDSDLTLFVPEQKVEETLSQIVTDDLTTSYPFMEIVSPVSTPTLYFIGTSPMKPITYKETTYSMNDVVDFQSQVSGFTNLTLGALISSNLTSRGFPSNSPTCVILFVPEYNNPKIHYLSNTAVSAATFSESLPGGASTDNYVDLSLSPGANYDLNDISDRFRRIYDTEFQGTYVGSSAPDRHQTTAISTPFKIIRHNISSFGSNTVAKFAHKSTISRSRKLYIDTTTLPGGNITGSSVAYSTFFPALTKQYESVYVNGPSNFITDTNTGEYFFMYLDTNVTLGTYEILSGNTAGINFIELFRARQLFGSTSNFINATNIISEAVSTSVSSLVFNVAVASDDNTGANTRDLEVKTLSFSTLNSPQTRPYDSNIDIYYYTSEEDSVKDFISFTYVNDVVSFNVLGNEKDLIAYIYVNRDSDINGEKKYSIRFLKGTTSFLKTNIPYDPNHGFSTILHGESEAAPGSNLNFDRDFLRYNTKKFEFRMSDSNVYNSMELCPYGTAPNQYLGLKITPNATLNKINFSRLGVVINPGAITGTEIQKLVIPSN